MEFRNAYATQYLNESTGKSEWIVYLPDGSEFFRLPASLDEQQVMACIKFGRAVEDYILTKQKELTNGAGTTDNA